MQTGKSTNYFPRKYELVVYILEFSSLKNTSLSTAKPKIHCITEAIVKLMQTKNSAPARENRLFISQWFSPTDQNTPPYSKPRNIAYAIFTLSFMGFLL